MNDEQRTTNQEHRDAALAGHDDVLISVRGVSKKFCRSLKKSLWYGLQDMGRELIGGRDESGLDSGDSGLVNPQSPNAPIPQSTNPALRAGEFWAVNNVSFELKRGECLGLIGHNGAGKTTLLKMLNGLIKPDHGTITMRGRVGALIALGAGFNPILTGRENIYINGSVLGLSKREIDGKIEEIINFAEIGDFIDTPVQNYSSGMNVRLGFAVASTLEPDVLLLDEVLAVGDIGFVIKCLSAIRRLSARSAVVFVSHNMQYVSSFCSRVIMMDHGETVKDAADPAEAIDQYFKMIRPEVNRAGTGEAVIHYLGLKDVDSQEACPRIEQGEPAGLVLDFEFGGAADRVVISIYVMDASMSPIMCFPLADGSGNNREFARGRHRLEIPLGTMELNTGKYSLTVAIVDARRKIALLRAQGLSEFRVFASSTNWAHVVRPVCSCADQEVTP